MSFLGIGLGPPPDNPQAPIQTPDPLPGAQYLQTLHTYLQTNLPRLAPQRSPASSSRSSASTSANISNVWQQSYTLLTLGLDPSSAPLSRNVKVPLTLGFGQGPSTPAQIQREKEKERARRRIKPLSLRLPPDRLLYLLLRWQTVQAGLPHVGRTDEPVPEGVAVSARGSVDVDGGGGMLGGIGIGGMGGKGGRGGRDGDAESVRSWVGSVRSVSLRSVSTGLTSWTGGWGIKEEVDEDKLLLALYEIFTVLPSLLIHPPFSSDRQIAELIDAGGYTQLGGIDVRVPLDVLRNLQTLELESYDPRALLIPPNPALRSLTVRDVQDADDWIEELLTVPETIESTQDSGKDDDVVAAKRTHRARFPNLQHLSLPHGSLLDLPSLPLTALTHLDLSHNLLETLPTSLSNLQNLTSLNLSDNVITHVRSAPSILGNISTLNLARNRIDCLVGLERVRGLQRVDLRGNRIEQWDEIGRLADLPIVREIWWEGNPAWGDEERIELGVMFAQHGLMSVEDGDVVLDGKEWSWSERRKVEGLMVARGIVPRARGAAHVHGVGHGNGNGNGHGHGHVRAESEPASRVTQPLERSTREATGSVRSHIGPSGPDKQTATEGRNTFHRYNPPPPPTPNRFGPAKLGPSSNPNSTNPQSATLKSGGESTTSTTASPASTLPRSTATAQKKRRPARRVIDLDTSEGEDDTTRRSGDQALGAGVGGSVRLPKKGVFEPASASQTGGAGRRGDQADKVGKAGKVDKDGEGRGEDGTTHSRPGQNGHEPNGNGQNGKADNKEEDVRVRLSKKERRRISTSMFEPSTTTLGR